MAAQTLTSAKSPFDRSFWKTVNAALDGALELPPNAQESYLQSLAQTDPSLAKEVGKLLSLAVAGDEPETRAPSGLTTISVRSREATAARADSSGITSPGSVSFDRLLKHALGSERRMRPGSLRVGERCGPWQLAGLLGRGGMGEVWLAERADGLYQAKAAVKFLRHDGDPAKFEARFSQERALLARLNHPGIARLLDAGHQFGMPYLVLEFVEGESLLDYTRVRAPTISARLELIRQIGEAIAYAHSQLVVHRDLKPSNILVSATGQVKLLDFGVAGLLNDNDLHETAPSDATRLVGRGMTIEYASPEQISGDATGVASDVYSLGALGFHLLCGHRAHLPEKAGRAALEHAVLHTDAPRLSQAVRSSSPDVRDNIAQPGDADRIGADLDAIFARALRRDPAARYRSVEEFLADLRRFSERRPIAARREDRAYRTRLWFRRNWLPASLGATLAAALVVGLGASLWQANRAHQEAERANRTATYLSELLSGADPDLHGGNWPTVLNLIERAQADLSTKFAGEPSVEQKLSFTVATILRRLSRFDEAKPIAQRAYDLGSRLQGENAENTRMAGALLADILYWTDKTEDGIPIIEKAIGDKIPNPMPEWWREAFLLRANMYDDLRKYPDALAHYDRYRELIRGHALENWLEAEVETDRALTLMSMGRHRESLALHERYRVAISNPPPHAKRISLSNSNNGVIMRLHMGGDAADLERSLMKNVEEWDRLAGRYNFHSMQAVSRLGLFYYLYDRPQEALATFEEKLKRARSLKTSDDSVVLGAKIDIVETKGRYLTQEPEEISREADSVEREVHAAELPGATRDRYLQRLALVRVTFGEVIPLAKSVIASPPTVDPDGRFERAATRWTAAASLLAALGKYDEACNALNFAAAQVGEMNRTLVSVPLYLRRALFCMLSGSNDTARHLSIARQAIPDTLPSTHRLRFVYTHLERAAVARDVSEVRASQAKLAAELAIPRIVNLPPTLLGLAF